MSMQIILGFEIKVGKMNYSADDDLMSIDFCFVAVTSHLDLRWMWKVFDAVWMLVVSE
jgi:hypothetical protein